MSPETVKFTNSRVGYCEEHNGQCICVTCDRAGDCYPCPTEYEESIDADPDGNCPHATYSCEGYYNYKEDE